jgi:hypothetical protein
MKFPDMRNWVLIQINVVPKETSNRKAPDHRDSHQMPKVIDDLGKSEDSTATSAHIGAQNVRAHLPAPEDSSIRVIAVTRAAYKDVNALQLYIRVLDHREGTGTYSQA